MRVVTSGMACCPISHKKWVKKVDVWAARKKCGCYLSPKGVLLKS